MTGATMDDGILLLDVDGVVSPFGVHSSPAWPDWQRVRDSPFHLVVSRQQARRLEQLPLRIVWLTTWEHRANEVVAPALGWPEREVVELEEGGMHPERWTKLLGLRSWWDDDAPRVAWVDDDLTEARQEAARRWADEAGVDLLLLAPSSATGLTEDHIRRIERWATG